MVVDQFSSSPSIFSAVLKYASIFSAALYFGGFAYVKFLFKQFNVDIWELRLGFVEVIPFFWSAARQLARLMFGSVALSALVLILVPALFALAEYGYRTAIKKRTLRSIMARYVGLVNMRFYLPTIAMLLTTFILVSLIEEAANYQRDIVVRQQRTSATLTFKTPESEQKFLNITRGKSVYFFAATQDWFFLFTCQQDECRNGKIETVYVPRNSIESARFHY